MPRPIMRLPNGDEVLLVVPCDESTFGRKDERAIAIERLLVHDNADHRGDAVRCRRQTYRFGFVDRVRTARQTQHQLWQYDDAGAGLREIGDRGGIHLCGAARRLGLFAKKRRCIGRSQADRDLGTGRVGVEPDRPRGHDGQHGRDRGGARECCPSIAAGALP